MTDDEARADRDSERVAQLFADLADDPAAPPSSVTAQSVIAAAKAASAASADDHTAQPDGPGPADAPTRPADVIEFRPRRRRFAVAGLVAAASLAGISALVISLSVTGGSSTSTSADGARAASAESAGSFESAAESAAAAVQPPAAALPSELSAAAPQADSDADAAAGGAQDNSAAAAQSGATQSGAAQFGAGGSGQELAAAGCWPELSDRALSALTAALPAGAFGPAMPLTADCRPAAVGGAILPGTAPGTVLVVRVSAAVPGACVSDTSLGTACVARGDDVYLASDESGSPVVYAYGNGDQVVVSGWPASGDSVALPSGLTVDQSVAAAEAVLGSLG
jgi:hypothetical protein